MKDIPQWVFGCLAIFLISWQLIVSIKLKEYEKVIPCSIEMKNWITDKKVYRKGDVVKFTYTRTVTTGDTFIFLAERYQKVNDSSDWYPGEFTGIYYDFPSTRTVSTYRKLPDYLDEGDYQLVGWIYFSASTESKKIHPCFYTSNVFHVTSEIKPVPATFQLTP